MPLRSYVTLAEDLGRATPLVFTNEGGEKVRAVAVMRRKGGVLVCVPRGACTDEELAAGNQGASGLIGPSAEFNAPLLEGDGELECILLDLGKGFTRALDSAGAAEVEWVPGEEEAVPDPAGVLAQAQAWVAEQNMGRLTDYATADEGLPLRAAGAGVPTGGGDTNVDGALALILSRLDEMGSRLEALEEGQVRHGGDTPGRPAGALAAATSLVGKAPPVRPPRRTAAPAAPTTPVRPLAMVADDEEEDPETTVDLNQAVQLLLAQQLQQAHRRQARARKKRVPGIADSDSDEEDSEAGSELHKLPGANGALSAERLRKAMRKHPREYLQRMESNMAAALEQDAIDAHAPTKFLGECMPIGTQRTLGYFAALMAHVHASLIRGEVDRARMLSVTGLMAMEQSALDGNWKAAWKLTGLQQPPWHEWSAMDIGSVRREYAKSRLADSQWTASVIADMRDEDFLQKRRGPAGGKGGGKDKKEDGTA